MFGDGTASRDFTYVDDVVEAVHRLIGTPPTQRVLPVDSLSPVAPWRAVNVAGGRAVSLGEFIAVFEAAVGKSATFNRLPPQAGDVHHTRADTSLLQALIGYVPQTSLPQGAAAVVEWYRGYTPSGVIAPAVLRIVVEHALGLLDRQQRAVADIVGLVSTPGNTSASSEALARLITVSALAMMNASKPRKSASIALRTACAPSRASI